LANTAFFAAARLLIKDFFFITIGNSSLSKDEL